MTLHDLYLAAQQWWLAEAGGPGLLFAFRIVSGTLAIAAAIASILNALRPNELEHTWTAEDCQRFKLIAWIKAFGCVLAACYFLCAAAFESERTSSPHRLLINNAWASLTLAGIALDSVAWRYHYLRKRMLLRVQGENVAVRP